MLFGLLQADDSQICEVLSVNLRNAGTEGKSFDEGATIEGMA